MSKVTLHAKTASDNPITARLPRFTEDVLSHAWAIKIFNRVAMTLNFDHELSSHENQSWTYLELTMSVMNERTNKTTKQQTR